MLHAVRIAKDNRASLIALTGLARSPLSKLADVTLNTTSPESRYRSEAVASRIAQLCIIDALVVALYLRDEERLGGQWQLARAALTEKRV